MLSTTEIAFVKAAPKLNVNRWSDLPEIDKVIDDIFAEVLALRTKRVMKPDKLRTHLKVCAIDLWAANKLSLNPYRSYSRNKTDYQKPDRYRKTFLTYDYLIPVVDDLIRLGYAEQVKGYRDRSGGPLGSRYSRIRATDKLISKFDSPVYGLSRVISAKGLVGTITLLTIDPDSGKSIEPETIILRDKGEDSRTGKNIKYRNTADKRLMRDNLARINTKLAATRIALMMSDKQFDEVVERISSEASKRRRTIDFSNKRLVRIFNNGTFDDGGRFYRGWWQELPKEYRKYIEIDHQNTVELDYSGHHIRMLYAVAGLTPPDDPFDLPDFPRIDQKRAMLIILNAKSKKSALSALREKEIAQPNELAKAMEDRHGSIGDKFYTGIGIKLQRIDSDVAEEVMLRMLDLDAAVLPLHDSFIVRARHESNLRKVMEEVFQKRFSKVAKLKLVDTVIDANRGKRIKEGNTSKLVELEEALMAWVDFNKSRTIFGAY